MERIIKGIPGVESATVDFDAATVTVTCTSAVTPEQISEAVDASGLYTAAPKN